MQISSDDEIRTGGTFPLQIKGDATVVDEVVARYAALQAQFEDVPAPAVAISPSNYRFRFAGDVKAGGTAAFVYRCLSQTTSISM